VIALLLADVRLVCTIIQAQSINALARFQYEQPKSPTS
jgi:hypothetical protein